jgi:hypothetical protein
MVRARSERTGISSLRGLQADRTQKTKGLVKERYLEPADCQRCRLVRLNDEDALLINCHVLSRLSSSDRAVINGLRQETFHRFVSVTFLKIKTKRSNHLIHPLRPLKLTSSHRTSQTPQAYLPAAAYARPSLRTFQIRPAYSPSSPH